MFISEMELHGFKSFAIKTKVKFGHGVTAIVGPNGCGKSNIVDALRWVLGEQRPTHLRSAAMNDVVFNGTAQKKALGMAEVSLTLINNKGVLPVEYSEVTITRRLYRSGQSEYLLNNTICRLKDIMDLFMDTGMGSDAYSVIELKMVEEILNDKNNERRRLFEEAAGVTRYKEKRRQTLRKLEETLADVRRVEDIIQEVRKKTRSLEIQSEKAEKAKVFRDELDALDHQYNRHEYDAIQAELGPLIQKISQLEMEKERLEKVLGGIEGEDEKARKELYEVEIAQAEAQKKVNETQQVLQDVETTVRITREKITAEKGVVEQYTREVKQGEQDLKELESVRAASETSMETLDGELQRSEASLKESKEGFGKVQQNYSRVRGELLEAEIEVSNVESELRDAQTAIVRLESRMESASGDLGRLSRDVTDLEESIAGMEKEKEKSLKEQDKARAVVAERRTLLEAGASEKEQLEQTREEQRETLRQSKSRLDAHANELQLLQGLLRSREQDPESVNFLRDSHANQFSRLDLVGDLFQTKEEFAVAVESALGESARFVVVNTLEEARKGIELLRIHDKGRATFIPLKEIPSSSDVLKNSLAAQVSCETTLRPLVNLLLGQVQLIDSFDGETPKLEKGAVMGVTREGDRFAATRFVEGGSRGRQTGVRLSLRDKMDTVTGKILAEQKTLEKAEKALQETIDALEAQDLGQRREALQEAEEDLGHWVQENNRIISGMEVYRKNLIDLRNRRSEITTSEGSVKEEMDKLVPRLKTLEKTLAEHQKRQQALRKQLEALEEERSIVQNRFNDAQLRHQDVRNKVENLERERARAVAGIETVTGRVASRRSMIEQSGKKVSEFETTIAQLTDQLDTLKERKTDAENQLNEKQEKTAKQRGAIQDLEKQIRELRNQKDLNLEILHLQQLTREKQEMKAKSLSDHIWETYGLLMNQLKVEVPEDFDSESARVRISELRQQLSRMGDVNPLAIEEYREEKERLAFLEGQIKDLVEAEVKLRETIDEINQTATQRFEETFEQVRTNFKQVFSTLFKEGDTCDLLVDQEAEDPLEARIQIRANPSGKRPSGISQLSGGEKTLTAIALLFAIYLVKPSPFCVLDEVDAPLDDANIERFANMIRQFSKETQFIIITHNKKTMTKAEMMYGVTMPETGVSRLVGVKLDEVTGD